MYSEPNKEIASSEKNLFRKTKGMRRYHIFAGIFIAAVITVLYISNLMYVNKLLKEVHYLNKEYEIIVLTNEMLEARIVRLESPERIIPYADSKLGMIISDEAPKIIK